MYTLDRLWYMYTNVLWTDYGTCIHMYCREIMVHVYTCTVDRLQYMYTNVLWTDYSTCMQMYCGQITVYKCTFRIDYA